jgi:NAD(P)-dependent dehydrogenase (short-subunit alcohol dehydrogenase family)
VDRIESLGARLVFIGNGAASFARGFRADLGFHGPLLVDEEMRAYRVARLRRGPIEALSPRIVHAALRAWRGGARPASLQGDPWQLGGVFVIRPGNSLSLARRSATAGDHPDPDEILAALGPDAPEVPALEPPRPLRAAVGRVLSRALDPTIFFSFDRIGYWIHQLGFDARDLELDLSSRRCLITGGNSGIGRATAEALADLGAQVVLLCRDPARGEAAAREIRQRTGNPRVLGFELDVSDLEQVAHAAQELGSEPVHVLIHNAGVLPGSRGLTREGIETAWATHVAGPHALTRALRPALERAGDARVIFVSSGGMYTQRLSLEDTDWTRRIYDGVVAYAQTKRAQVVLAGLWQSELARAGVRVDAMHPGWADTPAVRESLPRFALLMSGRLRTPAEGADTVVWLAAAPRAGEAGGGFYFDRKRRSEHLLPWTRETGSERAALWSWCEASVQRSGAIVRQQIG